MSQLSFFEAALQSPQPIARSQPHSKLRSPRPISKSARQIPLTDSIAPVARPLQRPIAPQPATPAPSITPALPAPASPPLEKRPEGWVSPVDPSFNPIKNCRLCGALIKIGGLDHSLCSGDCGWVVDLQWLAWMEARRRKRKEPEPQAATHTHEDNGSETLDLFTYGIDGGES